MIDRVRNTYHNYGTHRFRHKDGRWIQGAPREEAAAEASPEIKNTMAQITRTENDTVRHNQEGKILTTDGPFTETKEQLARDYILDCDNIDEAIQWAGKIPTGCLGGEGCVEIRSIRTMTIATTS